MHMMMYFELIELLLIQLFPIIWATKFYSPRIIMVIFLSFISFKFLEINLKLYLKPLSFRFTCSTGKALLFVLFQPREENISYKQLVDLYVPTKITLIRWNGQYLPKFIYAPLKKILFLYNDSILTFSICTPNENSFKNHCDTTNSYWLSIHDVTIFVKSVNFKNICIYFYYRWFEVQQYRNKGRGNGSQ